MIVLIRQFVNLIITRTFPNSHINAFNYRAKCHSTAKMSVADSALHFSFSRWLLDGS